MEHAIYTVCALPPSLIQTCTVPSLFRDALDVYCCMIGSERLLKCDCSVKNTPVLLATTSQPSDTYRCV